MKKYYQTKMPEVQDTGNSARFLIYCMKYNAEFYTCSLGYTIGRLKKVQILMLLYRLATRGIDKMLHRLIITQDSSGRYKNLNRRFWSSESFLHLYKNHSAYLNAEIPSKRPGDIC